MKTDTKNNRYKHHRMRLVKSRARELMLAGENHLLLIFSLLIIGTTAIIPQLIFGIIYAFYPYLIVDIVCVVFTALLIAPLVYGVLRLVWRSANGEKCTIADLFEAFYTLEDYFRSFLLLLWTLLIAAIEVILLILPIAINEWMIDLAVKPLIADAVGIVGFFGVLFGLLLFNSRIILFPMLTASGERVLRSIGRSVRITKKKAFRLLGYRISCLPLLIISVLGVLVPMIIYTAPYMLCAYAIGTKMMLENNNE